MNHFTYHPDRTDDDSKVFEFDPLDSFNSECLLHDTSSVWGQSTAMEQHSTVPTRHLDPIDSHPNHWDADQNVMAERVSDKGKQVLKPRSIRPHLLIDPIASEGSASSSSQRPNPLSPIVSSPQATLPFDFPSNDVQDNIAAMRLLLHSDALEDMPVDDQGQDAAHHFGKGKGKARELPPSLPPLHFSPTDFNYEQAMVWPSQGLISATPGASSYGSGFGSITDGAQIPLSDHRGSPPPSNGSSPTLRRIRPRSLSNLSVHSDGPNTATCSGSRFKATLNGTGILARKFLFRKPVSPSSPVSHAHPTYGMANSRSVNDLLSRDEHQGGCLPTWRDVRLGCDIPLTASFSNLDLGHDGALKGLQSNRCLAQTPNLYTKARSNSSPFPLSGLHVIPTASRDVLAPIPIVLRNYFDELLPRELRLEILASIVTIHQDEYDECVSQGLWTLGKATSSRNKIVGRDKGIRELVKMSRVSKAWQGLVFDGQLWTKLNLCAFPKVPTSLIVRLSQMAGPFIRALNLAGHTRLLSATLIRVTDELRLQSAPGASLGHTQLTAVNLQGCTALTARALHILLANCPLLHSLCLKGLRGVTNATCDLLATHCHQLSSVDLSRCPNIDGDGIRAWVTTATSRRGPLLLKELRISGLKRVGDDVMSVLGKGTPYLEVLDLSYASDLHNSAIEAFVSCDDGGDQNDEIYPTVLLTARQAGRSPSDPTRYRRQVTRLRHLSLSSCSLLTDIACSHLAYAVPQLEFLELAGIGPELRDDGLVRLLSTTPLIRKLDLEDASEITDAVLTALTPASGPGSNSDSTAPAPGEELGQEPGHALEHLVISYAMNVRDEALRALMRGCGRLRVLEADNTRLTGGAIKEFVGLCRTRGALDARVVAIDCRSVGETSVRDIVSSTRPRLGWRAYEARRLLFVDGRDEEAHPVEGEVEDQASSSPIVGKPVAAVRQDECDEKRVVLKSFYSWQMVDSVRTARESARRKGKVAKSKPAKLIKASASTSTSSSSSSRRRNANESSTTVGASESEEEEEEESVSNAGRARWWSPSGRSGRASPTNAQGDGGCRIA